MFTLVEKSLSRPEFIFGWVGFGIVFIFVFIFFVSNLGDSIPHRRRGRRYIGWPTPFLFLCCVLSIGYVYGLHIYDYATKPVTALPARLMPAATATNTTTSTPTSTATATPSPTATSSSTHVPPTATRTSTPLPTATNTATMVPSPNATSTATETPSPTATSSSTHVPPTATRTPTVSPTRTPTATDTATSTPTSTATDTATAVPSPTATSTATTTPSPTPTLISYPIRISDAGSFAVWLEAEGRIWFDCPMDLYPDGCADVWFFIPNYVVDPTGNNWRRESDVLHGTITPLGGEVIINSITGPGITEVQLATSLWYLYEGKMGFAFEIPEKE